MMDTLKRFTAAIMHPVGRRTTPTPEAPPTPIDMQAFRLVAWSQRLEAKEVFLPYLDELIQSADDSLAMSIDSHARMSYVAGNRDAFRFLRARFTEWAGTASD
jgi:hypothetical protein